MPARERDPGAGALQQVGLLAGPRGRGISGVLGRRGGFDAAPRNPHSALCAGRERLAGVEGPRAALGLRRLRAQPSPPGLPAAGPYCGAGARPGCPAQPALPACRSTGQRFSFRRKKAGCFQDADAQLPSAPAVRKYLCWHVLAPRYGRDRCSEASEMARHTQTHCGEECTQPFHWLITFLFLFLLLIQFSKFSSPCLL